MNERGFGGPPQGYDGSPSGTGGPPPGAGGPPPGTGGPPQGMGNPLGSAPVRSLMMKFAIPSIIGMLVSALYNMVDQLFIGRAVGPLGNAATGIAFPFTTACMAVALLFGIGGASCFNLTLGSGDKKKAPYFAGNALSLLAILGVLISAFTLIFLTPLLKSFGATSAVMPYAKEYVKYTAFGFPFLILTTGGGHLVRADGSPKMTMVCNITGAVINTVLDAVFVLGMGWGMKGAAIATVIGQFVSAVIVIVYCMNFKTVFLFGKHLIPSFGIVRRICSIGMASFFNQLAIALMQIVLNNSLRHYGELSKYGADDPIAVSSIVMKVNMIVFAIVIGLAQGTQPIESFNYGAQKYDRVKSAFWMAVKAGAVISIISFICFQLFPRQILAVFANKDASEGYYEFGAKFFRISLFFTWLNCLQPIISTFFTSIGKPVKGIFLSLTRQILFFIPLLLVLPLFFAIDGVVFAGPVADLLSAVVAILMARAEFKDIHEREWL
ncbi:MATE family efflux transporter [Ruminococcus flavefaciens]|uniref:MATE family efflux transporter n=1 Tax=Ruminococcus flavefaciens TaxID=1265 RepID=UPI0026F0E546|nr:MATE family efflux transporter [Ruminococcus flavefaciens]